MLAPCVVDGVISKKPTPQKTSPVPNEVGQHKYFDPYQNYLAPVLFINR